MMEVRREGTSWPYRLVRCGGDSEVRREARGRFRWCVAQGSGAPDPAGACRSEACWWASLGGSLGRWDQTASPVGSRSKVPRT